MSIRAIRKATNRLLGYDAREELTSEDYAAMMSEDFAATVIVKMREQGLKFKDLAQRMDMSPVALSRRLRSENMTMKTVAEFALALGYEVETPDLFTLDEAAAAGAEPTEKTGRPDECPALASLADSLAKLAEDAAMQSMRSSHVDSDMAEIMRTADSESGLAPVLRLRGDG